MDRSVICPVSSLPPAPLLRPLDDDTEMFPAAIHTESAVPDWTSDPSDFLVQLAASTPAVPAPSVSDEDISALFTGLLPEDIDFLNNFDFTSLSIPPTTGSSLDAAQGTSSPAPSSPILNPPPPDWPVLPPIVVSSPTKDSATPSVPESTPAPRKRRLEVEPANVINEPTKKISSPTPAPSVFSVPLPSAKRILSCAAQTPIALDRLFETHAVKLAPHFSNGTQTSESMNPDKAIAHGAAAHVPILFATTPEKTHNVTPLSCGIETAGPPTSNPTLLSPPARPRNITVPTKKSEIFSTCPGN
ncbi:hypothetical protein B0H19DRAFT_1257628 [Mycena capillaripes]|nr:hypothetical protein B0H19DRAFT_1257628 [Mycena capillaripes]